MASPSPNFKKGPETGLGPIGIKLRMHTLTLCLKNEMLRIVIVYNHDVRQSSKAVKSLPAQSYGEEDPPPLLRENRILIIPGGAQPVPAGDGCQEQTRQHHL